jgi:hypothetical protein
MRAGRKKKNEMRRQPGYIFWFIQMLNKGENIFLHWSCCACALYVCVLCNVTLCILLQAHAQAGDVLPYVLDADFNRSMRIVAFPFIIYPAATHTSFIPDAGAQRILVQGD